MIVLETEETKTDIFRNTEAEVYHSIVIGLILLVCMIVDNNISRGLFLLT